MGFDGRLCTLALYHFRECLSLHTTRVQYAGLQMDRRKQCAILIGTSFVNTILLENDTLSHLATSSWSRADILRLSQRVSYSERMNHTQHSLFKCLSYICYIIMKDGTKGIRSEPHCSPTVLHKPIGYLSAQSSSVWCKLPYALQVCKLPWRFLSRPLGSAIYTGRRIM